MSTGTAYAELAVTSNYTFLTGASHPEEMVEHAAGLGYRAVGIADLHTLAGIVRAHSQGKETGIPVAVGCRVRCMDLVGVDLVVYPTRRDAYARLCRMLTLGKRRAPKGECYLNLEDVVGHQEGMLCVVMAGAGTVAPDVRLCGQPVSEVPARSHRLSSKATTSGGTGDGGTDVELLLRRLKGVFDDDRLSLAISRNYSQDDERRVRGLAAVGKRVGVPLVAVNDAHYHAPERRALQDVLTCTRYGCTVQEAGLRLHANAERHLKTPEEMARLFAEYPRAIARTVEIAERASGRGGAGGFSLDELKYEYPTEPCPEGMTPFEYLVDRVNAGMVVRYPGGVPEKVTKSLEHELAMIKELRYEPYFLTCYDIVTFARSQGILCQGRGGAANSAVCYCLRITEVDPAKFSLLFERFISRERKEPPDIDIDFEHERREEVIQYLYKKYGRERAALTAEVITYRGRSAVRDVGKAMGLSLDAVDALAKNLDLWGGAPKAERIREAGFNPEDQTLGHVLELTRQLVGFPRHLSQHVGGFVITRTELSDLVPIENATMEERTVIEWDKDDIDAMGMLKVDVLGLGMLTCLRKCMRMVDEWEVPDRLSENPPDSPEGCTFVAGGGARRHPREAGRVFLSNPEGLSLNGESLGSVRHDDPSGVATHGAIATGGVSRWSDLHPRLRTSRPSASNSRNYLTLDRIFSDHFDDRAVYEMIQHADTIGVFQIESRAQMSMLPRLRPENFYDLVIEVAIVRPGPIQGGMVHPYLRRRMKEEEPWYPTADIKAVLERTLGVPLFQEQAMQLAIVAAGFTPDEADGLRRAMAAWKRKGDKIYRYGDKLVSGMLAKGYPREFAERCFEQIKGFSEYGFPESHAASFALLVYASAWLKCHHPAAFAASLINSQPMGFYQPAQIVRDAKEHGVEVREIDVNASGWDCSLEGGPKPALRLGMRLAKGLAEEHARLIEEAVMRHGGFRSVRELWRASGAPVAALRHLAKADAFGSMGLDRQGALWQIRPLRDEELPLFEGQSAECRVQREVTSVSETDGVDALPGVTPIRQMLSDYEHTGLSLKSHPMSFLREELRGRGVLEAGELRCPKTCPSGRKIAVAGVVLVRQRPATASGVVFITLEDETGIANLVIWSDTFERQRKVIRMSSLLLVHGKVERQGEVVHIHAQRFESLDAMLPALGSVSRDFH